MLGVAGGIGGVDASFQPEPDGAVLSIAPSADGKVYVGGSFQSIGGANGRFLAALDPSTGAADTAFNPMVAATVRAVVAPAPRRPTSTPVATSAASAVSSAATWPR